MMPLFKIGLIAGLLSRRALILQLMLVAPAIGEPVLCPANTSHNDSIYTINTSNVSQINGPQEWLESRGLVQQTVVEALFGQVAKTFVYGGAAVARMNNRMLCALLKRETEVANLEEPILYTFRSQLQRDRAFKIYSSDEITYELIEEARLDPQQATIILVHGWLGGLANEIWLTEAKNTALGVSDELEIDELALGDRAEPSSLSYRPNVIVVDWSKFAQGSLYSATENSHKVARRLGRLLEQLARVGHLRPELMHCLGHSIGAHICGQAARQAFPIEPTAAGSNRSGGSDLAARNRFGRISALDPGGFCYELGIRNETRFTGLRPSDALLVDAYYSNRSPFGNMYQVAQYNVRLNNGFFQQPCSVWRNSSVATDYFRATVLFLMGTTGNNEVISCDHYFATRFAHQKLSPECSYVAYACDSYRNFVRGRCGYCKSRRQCYSMDFEYQRPESSLEHTRQHIERYSSLLNGQSNQWETSSSPPGGVPYGQRRAYYMRVSNREPYCSYTYRVRVVLNPDLLNPRAFRADSIQLQLAGIVVLKDPSSGQLTNGIVRLHGPWLDSNDKRDLGLDDTTLTGLFELTRPERVRGLTIAYDNERNRRNALPFIRPIESVHFEYLSTRDPNIKAKYSSSFTADQVEIKYRRLMSAETTSDLVAEAA